MIDPAFPASLARIAFAGLAGWAEDDHAAAFAAFRRSAGAALARPPKTRALGIDGATLAEVGRTALGLPGQLDGAEARAFFEAWFEPLDVVPTNGRPFFTGYYEPEVEGSPVEAPGFRVPLYRRPGDLVEIDDSLRPDHLPKELRFARLVGGDLEPYPDRAAIDAGLLAGRGLELVWLADPVDAFFIHIQGSARIRLPGGAVMRVTYAAKTGHDYTPIGRVIADREGIPRASVTMATIREWLAAHPEAAAEVMQANRSYIFFREAPVTDPALGPVAAAGVPLTPGRSLAVDRLLHTFYTPVWIETEVPGAGPFRRLMFAEDTGSAIVGPARGDIFFGSGDAAGALAGAMQASGRFVVLAPRPRPVP